MALRGAEQQAKGSYGGLRLFIGVAQVGRWLLALTLVIADIRIGSVWGASIAAFADMLNYGIMAVILAVFDIADDMLMIFGSGSMACGLRRPRRLHRDFHCNGIGHQGR